MKARIVIGSNYGDEGKGTVVASYAKRSVGVLNVLTNGGSQRGHSILTKDGSMTFQHFGSGTYYGAGNYYSRFFILNPMQFAKEYETLVVKPSVLYRDKYCRWSTPYDSMANIIEEQQLGRTASCCMGIWNTIKRYRSMRTMTIDEFVASDENVMYLLEVKAYYESKITIPESWRNIWDSPFMLDHFINDCRFLCESVKVCDLKDVFCREMIFENGQGLLLCDTGKDTFDTTPSNTGIRYAAELISELDGVDEVTAHYVTRPYLTRHGDGAFIGESRRGLISQYIPEDRTNHYNDCQGEFRYGFLDIADLYDRILVDVSKTSRVLPLKNFETVLEVTHCDEMDRVHEFEKYFPIVKTHNSPFV